MLQRDFPLKRCADRSIVMYVLLSIFVAVIAYCSFELIKYAGVSVIISIILAIFISCSIGAAVRAVLNRR